MNKIYRYIRSRHLIARTLCLALVALLTTACSDDDLDPTSIFDYEETSSESEFDKWLTTNYVEPYNIRYNYRYIDEDTYISYSLIPADEDKAKALAILLKYVWLDGFAEVAGDEFLKTTCPRMIQLVGTPAYMSNNNIRGEIYEGGLQALIYNVNAIDIDNPVIDPDEPFMDFTVGTSDVNYWCFKTMSHLLCHLLTSEKSYSNDFQTITPGYESSGWLSLQDSIAPSQGFVSALASSEYDEDFAETFAVYTTHSAAAWQTILDAAGDEDTQTAILSKLEVVDNYFKGSWEIDLDDLRDVIVRRCEEAKLLDLRTLN